MARRKIDRHKLEAMANDPAASEAERAIAQRCLAGMYGEEKEGLVIGARESWEIALIELLVDRYKLSCSTAPGGFVRVEGEYQELNTLIDTLIYLHPKLESAVVSATAGFLAAYFPPIGPASARQEDAIQSASRQAAKQDKVNPAPKQIGLSSGPARLTSKS